ncbi:hypothetical protein ADJ79_05280 [Ottowia sp. oral taxon 894]|nr:hypothetical protein ADJ79_05280 [Ottowia sp. oral taxon 894]
MTADLLEANSRAPRAAPCKRWAIPNDPAAAFAQDFLGSVMSGLPMPLARPAAARDAREATLALLDETFGNTARDPRDTLLLAAGGGRWRLDRSAQPQL